MKRYVMSEQSRAVADAVRCADLLEKEFQDGDSSADRVMDIISELAELADILPYDVNGLPGMMKDFIMSSPEKKDSLKPVVDGFVPICRNGYLDYFNDSPDGGLKDVMVEDYWGTDSDRHALMIYITAPFMENIMIKGHTNSQEAVAMAETLRDLGYSVDIINPWFDGNIEYERYDLVIGFRRAFENMLNMLRDDCTSIYYLTTTNSYAANMAELQRIRDFEQRNGKRLGYERLEYSCIDLKKIYECDGAVCLGNDHTASTYAGMFKTLVTQNATGFDVTIDRSGINETYDFMWYGGAGSLHKGVDLCIEAFRNIPDHKFHIVGKLDDDVYEYYKEEIDASENVIYHGYMYREDEEFRSLCAKCTFSLGVSCSEGQSTAMLTTIFAGLIPVCNDETGIDTEDYGGIRIGSEDIKDLPGFLSGLSDMSSGEIEGRREKGRVMINSRHTVDMYKKQLSENITKIVSLKREKKEE